jgi:hypothetical protein
MRTKHRIGKSFWSKYPRNYYLNYINEKIKNKIEFFDILSHIMFITFHITYYLSLHLYFPSDMRSHSMFITSGIISVCLYFPWQYVSFGVYYFRQSYYSSLLYFPFKTTYVPYCIYYFWPYVLVSLFPIRSYVLSTFCPIQHFFCRPYVPFDFFYCRLFLL